MIGTEENPVRCSALPMLLSCPGFYEMRSRYDDEAGVAATLGTAVGRGAELFHHGTPAAEATSTALGEAEGALEEKDRKLVEKIVTAYCEDPRNGQLASRPVLPSSQEKSLKFEYEGIWFSGHVDQLRRHEDGKLYVWDLKNGSMYGGWQMVNAYSAQLAMYAIGASLEWGEEVRPGGIVRTRGYVGRANEKIHVGDRPVFFEAKWPAGTEHVIAKQVVAEIRRLQQGEVRLTPGSYCGFCPASGIGNCSRLIGAK